MSRIAYKLVDQDGYTRRGETGETHWLPVGKVVSPTGVGNKECGPGVLHAYISPEIGLIMNQIHAGISNPRLLKIQSDSAWETDGCKRWTTGNCTVLEELPVPQITTDQRVAFAICVAPHTFTKDWTIDWLRGDDRSEKSALAAEEAAWEEATGAWASAAFAVGVACSAGREAWEAAANAAVWAARESASRAARSVAAFALAEAVEIDNTNFESRLPLVWQRANAILAGEYPAEQYDAPYTGDTE